jgi:membrane-associated phospholipid phosphatase
MEQGLYEWLMAELYMIEMVQGWRVPLLDLYFRFMTFLGDEEFYLVSLPAIYWLFNKQLGRRLVFLLIFSNLLVSFLKNTFRMPRPPEELRLIQEEGFGLPSGHAMNGFSLWGYTAWRLRQAGAWIWGAAAVVILSITVSRIYLGVHYPTDAVTGLVLGIVTLLLYIWLERKVTAWLPQVNRRLLIPGIALLSLVLLFAHPGDEFHYPAERAVTLAGLFLGVSLGFIAEIAQVRFLVGGPVLQKILRYLLGITLAILFWLGLRVLFGFIEVSYPVESILRFVRYALTGIAITWLAPLLFVRLGLAEQEVDTMTQSQTLHTIGSGAK